MNLLVNLPAGFYRTPELDPTFHRLEEIATVRRVSHNTADEIAEDLAWAEAVLMWSWPPLDEALLDKAPNLRFAAHLDLTQRAARVAIRRGLPVSVGRSAFSPAVAEMALGLILSTLRRISDYHSEMRQGIETWVNSFPDDIDPRERELSGRPVGIVGFGRVGRRLRELLAPFGCSVSVYDPFLPDDLALNQRVNRVDLGGLLSNCDIVVLCAASNAGTAHLLGAKEIASLRPNTVLVNVARAALVDTPALVERLRRGDLFAAIDVFDQEPLPADHPLRTLPNAYLTPHRAGGTMGSVGRILNYLIDDLEAFLGGRERKHPLVEAMIPSLDA
jgi:phosphoglycerate dehydrogenase-like enzyme